MKPRSWLVLIQNTWEFYVFPSGVTKAGAVVTCRHISEPEFVETLLLLREGWQGGKGKQKRSLDLIWRICWRTFSSNSWPANTDMFSCCSVRGLLPFAYCFLLFDVSIALWDSENPDQVVVRDMSWFYHLDSFGWKKNETKILPKSWHSNVETFHQSCIEASTYLRKSERMHCIDCPTPPCSEERQEKRQEGKPMQNQRVFMPDFQGPL